MIEIIGVKFRQAGKTYYFDPCDHRVEEGECVVVETARGMEIGEVVIPNQQVADVKVVSPLKKMVRTANDSDKQKLEENHQRQKEAFRICEEKIIKHKLEMKLVDVEYAFDGSKILFYFTADGRVDFRDLVKDLAGVFRTRIELRQIGVRDESKMLGGLGICGRPFCCNTFLGEFAPVSIKMAKEQNLSLNPTKISGTCGRLMCCLKYEQAAYESLLKITPRQGSFVDTPEGHGRVVEVNLIRGTLKVRLDSGLPDAPPKLFNRDEVTQNKEDRERKPENNRRDGRGGRRENGKAEENKTEGEKNEGGRRERRKRPDAPRQQKQAKQEQPPAEIGHSAEE